MWSGSGDQEYIRMVTDYLLQLVRGHRHYKTPGISFNGICK